MYTVHTSNGRETDQKVERDTGEREREREHKGEQERRLGRLMRKYLESLGYTQRVAVSSSCNFDSSETSDALL